MLADGKPMQATALNKARANGAICSVAMTGSIAALVDTTYYLNRRMNVDVKLFELRDIATCIPVMAVRLAVPTHRNDAAELWLLRRAGYALEALTGVMQGTALRCPTCGYVIGADLAESLIKKNPNGLRCISSNHEAQMQPFAGSKDYDGEPYVILCRLDGVEAQYDSFAWPNQRTMGEAHRHIINNWYGLETGQVIDVQFVLGETTAPKVSERLAEH